MFFITGSRYWLLDTILLGVLLFAAAPAFAQDELPVFRVDAECIQSGATGRSWAYAFSGLQDGIDAAFNAGGGEVWVRAGVYKPSGEGRDSTFELRPGVRIYGGFRGRESHRGRRNAKANRTILNGDIGIPGADPDNCYHVLTGASDTLINGFTITRGNADGLKHKGTGGALFIPEGTRKMRISNCTFERNLAGWQGGAVYGDRIELEIADSEFFSNAAVSGGAIALRGSSSITISNALFSANSAQTSGGAIHLENAPGADIRHSRFLFNTSTGIGGALAVRADDDAESALIVSDCIFADNRADQTGGAVYLKGRFTPRFETCRFDRNNGSAGTGGMVIEGGAQAVIKACVFSDNRGTGKIDLFLDDISNRFESMEALQASLDAVTDEPEPEPVRELDEVYVYDLKDRKTGLRGIVAEKAITVLAAGDLTDTLFIENYRVIEALANDFRPLDVQFFYVYRALAHPENNGYVRPFSLKERKRQVQLAESLLNTQIPWLYDCMDNQTAAALAGSDDSNVYVYNGEGGEIYRGSLTDPQALRNALSNLAGSPASQTDPQQFRPPRLPAMDAGTPELFDRIHMKSAGEPFLPLLITPAASQRPFYVKLRAEGDEKLLETGSGKLYLGFHLDPLYRMEWDNKAEPLKYVIWTPAGIAAPSTDSAPEVNATRSDAEPREFLLSTSQLDRSSPLKLRVEYSVYSPLMNQSTTVAQTYTIYLEQDPFGGKAYRRQLPHSDPPRRNMVRMPHELRHMDTDRDGRISRTELSGKLWSKFPDIDTNKDGYLSAQEYSAYLIKR